MKLITAKSTVKKSSSALNGAGLSESCRGESQAASLFRTQRTRIETNMSQYLKNH
jgi:hypothetical protein